jgi:hypothetical protein
MLLKLISPSHLKLAACCTNGNLGITLQCSKLLGCY